MLAVHAADLHLGVANYAPINPATGLSRRIDDFFAAFDQAVEYALANEADLFLLCGDTFKDPNPNPTILKMFARRLARLSEAQVKTVIIVGNHDAPKEGRAAPPEPFIELKTPNVYFFSKPDLVDLECRSGDKARIFAIPYRHPVKVASEKRTDGTVLEREALARTFREQMEKEIEIFTRAGRKQANASVLVGHLSIEGATAGSERLWKVGEEFSVPPSAFETDVFDYVALGHVHRHQVIRSKIPIVYPGSIERVDFSEARESKGFVRVMIEKGLVEWKFIPVSTRSMYDIQVNCRSSKDPVLVVKESLRHSELDRAIVRLQLMIEEQPSTSQRDQIADLVKNAFWQEILYQKLAHEKVPIAGTLSGTLEPFQTLSKYLNTLKISESHRTLALKLGQQIIDETTAEVES
jgi:exonuclease SbcD